MYMDPKLLSQLCEVIEQGSLSRAAHTLGVTQPTLTRNIKAIEEQIGSPVLRRGRYGVTPTHLGERLAEQGRIIRNASLTAEEAVQHWQTGLAGDIRLGISTILFSTLMPEFLDANPMRAPSFTMSIVSSDTNGLLQKLRRKELDIAILTTNRNTVMESLVQDVLFEDQVCVLAGSQSPLINMPARVTTSMLSTQNWMTFLNKSRLRHLHDQVTQLLGIDEIIPKFRFDGNVAGAMNVLEHSDMLTLATRKFAEQHVKPGGIQIIEVDIDLPKRDVGLWINKDNQTDSIVNQMSKILKSFYNDTQTSTTQPAPCEESVDKHPVPQ